MRPLATAVRTYLHGRCIYPHKANANSDRSLGEVSSGRGSSRGLGGLPAGGAWPEGGRGSRGPSSRAPQGPGAPRTSSRGSRSWDLAAAGREAQLGMQAASNGSRWPSRPYPQLPRTCGRSSSWVRTQVDLGRLQKPPAGWRKNVPLD
jgi:hypothetical protein